MLMMNFPTQNQYNLELKMLNSSLVLEFIYKNIKVMQSTGPERPKQKNCQFIDKLIDMMQKYPTYIHWTQDGEELIITHLKEVQTQILPDYFRHQNFASFVRQLNMYGFCKKEKCQEFLRFTHKIFKQGNQNSYHLIQRKAKMRSIKNSQSKFYESNNKLIETIRTKSGLNDQAQQLTVHLLQYKQNINDAMRKIKFQLDKLFAQFKDTRSKNVRETLSFIQKQSYQSIIKSLGKSKEVDQFLNIRFNSQKKLGDKNQEEEEQFDQCSLEEQLQNGNNQDGDQKDSQQQINHRFQMDEHELSAFNQFQQQQ